MTRLLLLAVLLTLFTVSGSPLFGLAEAGDHVVTSDRLNLRSCAGTKGCTVLRTLPRGIHLDVVERQGEWLRVTAAESGDTGWVHASYTEVAEKPSSGTPWISEILQRDFLTKLLVALSILGALVTMAMFGRSLRPGATGGQLFALSGLSVLTGVVVLLNQFGPVVSELAAPWVSLQGVSFLWEVTGSGIGYREVILFLGAVTVGVTLVAPRANGGKLSFLQGVCTGFFALPLFTIITLLAALVFYILFFLCKALVYVLGILAIPFIWIFQHVLQPVLRFLAIPFIWIFQHIVQPVLQFLAIPFIWLWEHLLREIVEFLAIPLLWLWKVILRPAGVILFKFIVKPLMMLLLGIALALVGLLPFGIVGVVVLESLHTSFRGTLDSQGLFAQGVTAGFLLLDAAVLTTLNSLGVLHTVPPLSLAVPVALQLIVLLRLLAPQERAAAEASPVFQQKLVTYWSSSRLELVATCVLIPLSLLAALASEDN